MSETTDTLVPDWATELREDLDALSARVKQLELKLTGAAFAGVAIAELLRIAMERWG